VLRQPIESAQFGSQEFTTVIISNKLLASMGQAGTSAGSAGMESFFSMLQKNVLNCR